MASSIDKLDGATAVQRTAFIYNPEHERTRQVVSPMSGGAPGAASRTIWYGGGIEKEIDAAANTTTIRTTLPSGLGFIEEEFSGTNIAATASGTRNLRYFLTDHLGSTLVIVDQGLVVLQRMSYDAWGRRRNADGTDDTGPLWGSLKNTEDHSGYTGHETLDQLGLVNMNARFYDPILGRHTSADPTVPDPANAQAFNRYSYVLNNALVFTDPTGLSPSTNGFADHGGGMWDTTFVNDSAAPAAAGSGQASGVPASSEQSCTPANTSKDSIGPSQPSRSELLRVAAAGNGIATAAVGVAESVSRALAAFHVTTIDDIPYDYMTEHFLSPGAAQDARIETVIFGGISFVGPGAGPQLAELKQSMRLEKSVGDVANGLTNADFSKVATEVSQKQLRHVADRPELAARGGGSYLNSKAEAQAVLDAYHSGSATILGKSSQGFPVVRFNGITGTNVNVGAGFPSQPTNVFIIKGTASPSVVPTSPNWKP